MKLDEEYVAFEYQFRPLLRPWAPFTAVSLYSSKWVTYKELPISVIVFGVLGL